MKLVSFIIAAFNEEKHIRECVDSCLAQDYPNVEVCITDDGSTDATREILDAYKGDGRVKVHSFDENRGKVAAFNSSFSMAQGDYIAIMGADDIACTDRLSVSMSEIGAYPLLFGDLSSFSEQGILEQSLMERRLGKRETGEVGFSELIEKPCVFGGTILAKRESLDEVFPLDERLTHEDWWIPLSCSRGTPLKYVHHVMVHYRIHEGQSSGNAPATDRWDFHRWKRMAIRDRFYYGQVRSFPDLSSGQKALIDGKILLMDCIAEPSLSRRVQLWCRMIGLVNAKMAMKGFLCSLHPRILHGFVRLIR